MTAVSPFIEDINPVNWAYVPVQNADSYPVGGFMDDLAFNWFPQWASEKQRRKAASAMGLRDGIR